MEASWRQQLLELGERISLEELKTVCFVLEDQVSDLDFENLTGDTREAKYRGLIAFMEDRRKIPELLRVIADRRPDLKQPVSDIQAKFQISIEKPKAQTSEPSLTPVPPPAAPAPKARPRGIKIGIVIWWGSLSDKARIAYLGLFIPLLVAFCGLTGTLVGPVVTEWAKTLPVRPTAGAVSAITFDYSVRVQAGNTSLPIPNAKVTIEVIGQAPLDEITDSNGIARLFIDTSHAGQPARLIVRASGYQEYTQNIDLRQDALPDVVPLDLERVLTSGPTQAPTATYTPPPPTPTPWPVRPANTFIYTDPAARASITAEAASDPDRPNAIKLTFNNPVTGSYGGWGIDLGGFDASQKSALSFWVRGEKGGEQFEVGIKDFATQSGDEPKVSPLTASSTWQRISIPLSKFTETKQQNLSALADLSVGFTSDLGSGASYNGTIYVDGFVFEP